MQRARRARQRCPGHPPAHGPTSRGGAVSWRRGGDDKRRQVSDERRPAGGEGPSKGEDRRRAATAAEPRAGSGLFDDLRHTDEHAAFDGDRRAPASGVRRGAPGNHPAGPAAPTGPVGPQRREWDWAGPSRRGADPEEEAYDEPTDPYGIGIVSVPGAMTPPGH